MHITDNKLNALRLGQKKKAVFKVMCQEKKCSLVGKLCFFVPKQQNVFFHGSNKKKNQNQQEPLLDPLGSLPIL